MPYTSQQLSGWIDLVVEAVLRDLDATDDAFGGQPPDIREEQPDDIKASVLPLP